jgi:nucleotide-binding universal stress UspA family protein
MLTATERSTVERRVTDSPTIVVGYDGLKPSRHAVEVAAQRAGPEGTVVVLHVTEPISSWMGRPYRDLALEEQHMAAQRAFSELANYDLGRATIVPEVIEGSPAEALIRVAQGRDAREIVVGSRRLGRIRAMLGSVSHRVLARADRPVVIVPPGDGS